MIESGDIKSALEGQESSSDISWREVPWDDIEGIELYIQIMGQMAKHYQSLTPLRVQRMILQKHGRLLLYDRAPYQIVMFFVHSNRFGREYLWSVGVKGEAEGALKPTYIMLALHMSQRDLSEVYAIRPNMMDDKNIEYFHDLVRASPWISCEVVGQNSTESLWRLKPLMDVGQMG
jgi:hypothetical protein